jgi:hypothetical protein
MNTSETKHDSWRSLEKALKGGEKAIETYLRRKRMKVRA